MTPPISPAAPVGAVEPARRRLSPFVVTAGLLVLWVTGARSAPVDETPAVSPLPVVSSPPSTPPAPRPDAADGDEKGAPEEHEWQRLHLEVSLDEGDAQVLRPSYGYDEELLTGAQLGIGESLMGGPWHLEVKILRSFEPRPADGGQRAYEVTAEESAQIPTSAPISAPMDLRELQQRLIRRVSPAHIRRLVRRAFPQIGDELSERDSPAGLVDSLFRLAENHGQTDELVEVLLSQWPGLHDASVAPPVVEIPAPRTARLSSLLLPVLGSIEDIHPHAASSP